MTRARKFWVMLAVATVLLTAVIAWLVATPPGARFVMARADSALPAPLTLGDMQGTLTGGLSFDTITWKDDSVDVTAGKLFVHVELMPLLQRVVRIRELRTSSLDLRLVSRPADAASGGEPFELDLPVDILLDDARLERIGIVRGELARDIDSLELAASVRGSRLTVSRLDVVADWLTVSAQGESRLSRNFATEASVGWILRIDEAEFEGSLQVDGDVDGFEIVHSLARPFPVETSGRVAFDEPQIVVDLTNRWTDLRWPVGERELHSAEGALGLDGPIDELAIRLDALFRSDDLPVTSIALEGVTDLKSLDQLELAIQNEIGMLSARGGVRWSPTYAFEADYELSDFDPSIAHAAVSGDVGLKGTATGRFYAGDYALSARVDQVSGSVNNVALSGSGRVDIDNERLAVETLDIELGSNRLQLQGEVGEQVIASGKVTLDQLSELIPEVSGNLSADFDVSGSRQAPAVVATVQGRSVEWSGVSLDNAQASVSLTSAGVVDADLSFQQLSSETQTIDSGSIEVQGMIDDHRLSAEIIGLDSVFSMSARGGFAEPRWSGDLTALSVSNPKVGQWQSTASATLTASTDGALLDPFCIENTSGAGRLCLQGEYLDAGNATAGMRIEELPVAALRLPLPESVNAEGSLFVEAGAALVDGQLSGSSSVDLRDGRVLASIDGEEYETGFKLATANATLLGSQLSARMDVQTSDDVSAIMAQLNVDDVLLPDSAISGEISMRISSLANLTSFIPDLLNPQGQVRGDITIGGRVDLPEVTGDILLSDGSFGLRRAGIEVSAVDLSLSQSEPGSLRLRGSATSGEGMLAIEGDTYRDGDTGLRTELTIAGDRFQLLRLPDWQLSASPDVQIVVDQSQVLITGALEVPAADIRVNEIPQSATGPSSDAVVHRVDETTREEMRRSVDIDLLASLGDEVKLAAFGLDTGLTGSVQLRGGRGRPFQGFGRLELTDGSYSSYGQDLEIERGLLIFNGPLDNPQLDVRAIRQVGSVTAGIHLTGVPTALSSAVYSNPPLREAEALSYLLTGRPISTATSDGDGDLLANAAFALGMSGAGQVASRVRSQLGLETLSVEGGSDDSRIVAGKRLSDRLLVEYGYGLVDQLGSLLLRYQLNDRLVIESRTGITSNFDLYYRVRKQ
ncbi:MAG: translocation/assembly module TamB domain-containing protein [Woeseiaceae bacterium]|nr:translocation/assembly module TamB domain-containing protein [Woeseiaceae bacterium]